MQVFYIQKVYVIANTCNYYEIEYRVYEIQAISIDQDTIEVY